MSLVYITYHDENILDIDKEDFLIKRQKLKYTSKFHDMVQKEASSRHVVNLNEHRKLLTTSAKNYHQTMGCARTPLNPPCKYLRKHQGIQWQRLNEHECPPKKPVPPVPRLGRRKPDKPPTPKKDPKKKERRERRERRELKRDERGNCPKEGGRKKYLKNFVLLNINKMKSASARQRPPRYVDTPQGDVHDLLGTGLMPQYMCSKNFARVPCYLAARKKQLARLSQPCSDAKIMTENACVRIVEKLPGVRKLTNEERDEIVDGLKTNFSEVFKVYQSLSLYTDTVAKKLRKSKLEGELRQLEQDIYVMESNPEIFITEY